MTALPEMKINERFHATVEGQAVDRLPMIEWATWWSETITRWKQEGLPCNQRYQLYKYFDLDLYYQDWLTITKPGFPKPSHHECPILSTMEEYEKFRQFLYPENAVGDHWAQWAEDQKNGKAAIWFTFSGFFWFPRTLFGIEPHLFAFYDQPYLMHRMNQDLVEWALRQVDYMCEYATPDFMTFGEDLSYNNGPMLSEAMFDEFLLPYYNQIVPKLKERGIKVFIDSDGDVTLCAPWFERAGIDGILPLERQAGVDINVLQKNHPSMAFIGHYDKMVMPLGESAMRAEFERLLPAMRHGRFVPSVDHQTPPGVSLDQYRTYLQLLKEYSPK